MKQETNERATKREIWGHGPRDMSIWGAVFKQEAGPDRGADLQAYARMLEIVYYIESIQAPHAKDGMKQQTGAAEHPQEGSGATPQAAAARDSQGKRASQQEQADEGSH